jgi:hypothetical protein
MNEGDDPQSQGQVPLLQYGHVERRKPSYYVRVFIGVGMTGVGIILLLAFIADINGGYGRPATLPVAVCLLLLTLGPWMVVKK